MPRIIDDETMVGIKRAHDNGRAILMQSRRRKFLTGEKDPAEEVTFGSQLILCYLMEHGPCMYTDPVRAHKSAFERYLETTCDSPVVEWPDTISDTAKEKP